jgi:hypothetical protein
LLRKARGGREIHERNKEVPLQHQEVLAICSSLLREDCGNREENARIRNSLLRVIFNY